MSVNLYVLLPMWDVVAVSSALNMPKEYFLNQGWNQEKGATSAHFAWVCNQSISVAATTATASNCHTITARGGNLH